MKDVDMGQRDFSGPTITFKIDPTARPLTKKSARYRTKVQSMRTEWLGQAAAYFYAFMWGDLSME
jgi:hypothetical protein